MNNHSTDIPATQLHEVMESIDNKYLNSASEVQTAVAQEQEKFKKIAGKVAHDIRSSQASLLMIVRACHAIPERERNALSAAATAIGDLANNLIHHYEKKEVNPDYALPVEGRESILVSSTLLQILTEKKCEYHPLSIKFDHRFSPAGNFSWIKIEPGAFNRMLSDIINNAVHAIGSKAGKIGVVLDADEERVHISIEDNGKGIAPEWVEKMLSGSVVSENHGYGTGLTRVHKILQKNQGYWNVESQPGAGTKFTVTFPRAQSLNWIAETISLTEEDTVIILDDDISIHMAWDSRFDPILKEFQQLKIKHFEQGQEAIDFINSLAPDEKKKLFLLADYELLTQNLNGVDVIKKTDTSRAILVTSHYAHQQVQHSAADTDTKILPKQLASDIPVTISPAIVDSNLELRGRLKQVDAIFVDDDQRLLNSFTYFAFNKKVDTYQDPRHFLNRVNQYPKHTKIMLDQHFDNFEQKGSQIAEQLHALGFTRLYLLSGDQFTGCDIPDYLTPILKTDLEKVEAILNEK